MSKTNARPDWEFFLTDLNGASPVPRVPLRLRGYAIACTARALCIYRKRGWGVAHRYLEQLRPGPESTALATLPPETAIRLARREIFTSQLVLRTLIPDGLCLPRSFALTTYLSAIGLPAEVTIARGRTAAVPKNSFHSWTELYGTVLNDNPDVQLGYSILQRVRSRT
jgi:hypothetical protein